jgi:GNAT superfamily N-acetyltransferase
MSTILEKEATQLLKYSPLESNRFGARVFRGELTEVDPNQISSFLQAEKVDIAIFRIPTENSYQISRCLETSFPFITADTLVYYNCNLNKYQPNALKNELTFIECTENNTKVINDLVNEIFIDYTNHYFSNPVLDKQSLLEGYKEWARSYIGEKKAGKISWIVQKGKDIVGFATCDFDEQSNECEGILYGVLPTFSGKGIYGDIIRFTQQYFKDNGYRDMKVSTQIQNYAVQKVWGREGFVLEKALNTVHINSFLSEKV